MKQNIFFFFLFCLSFFSNSFSILKGKQQENSKFQPRINLKQKHNGLKNEKLRQLVAKSYESLKKLAKVPYLLDTVYSMGILGLAYYVTVRSQRHFIKKKFDKIEPKNITISLNEIVGSGEAKEAVHEIIDYKNGKNKVKPPTTILLTGVPGTGKTTFVRAAAKELNIPMYYLSASEFNEMYIGVGGARIRQLFEDAEKTKPCIIFIDEIDAIGTSRLGVDGERKAVLNQLLKELDKKLDNIVVFAATNYPQELDEALGRFGRFDKKIEIKNPTKSDRLEFLKRVLSDLESDVTYDDIEKRIKGFGLATLVNFTNRLKFKAKESKISKNLFEGAYKEIISSMNSLNLLPNAIKKYHPFEIEGSFDTVAGMKIAVEEMKQVADFFNNPEKYQKIKARMPKGILLYGPPGTGKTSLARALANESGAVFFHVPASALDNREGLSTIAKLYKDAREVSPSIIFIDEVDVIAAKRTSNTSGSSSSDNNSRSKQILLTLIEQMDGLKKEDDKPVVTIFATNRKEDLDPAVMRPGRVDLHIYVGLPNQEERKEIVELYAKKSVLSSDLTSDVIAQQTDGFSPAELENLFNLAAVFAGRADKTLVEQADITKAIEKVIANRSV